MFGFCRFECLTLIIGLEHEPLCVFKYEMSLSLPSKSNICFMKCEQRLTQFCKQCWLPVKMFKHTRPAAKCTHDRRIVITLLRLPCLNVVWWRRSWLLSVSRCLRTSTWCCSTCRHRHTASLTTPPVRRRRSSNTVTAPALCCLTPWSLRWWSLVWWWCTV